MTIWGNLIAIAIMVFGLWLNNTWIAAAGCAIALVLSIPIIYRGIRQELLDSLSPAQRLQLVASITVLIAIVGLLQILEFFEYVSSFSDRIDWNAVGASGEWGGAFGQILIAILAVYIAWRQYIISRDLTIEQNRLTTQQNILTQQQTIDTYFQGISDLVLDDDGFLEDWPQEQAFAAGRTAALLGSIDAAGKAKVLRFLSQSKLLTPLRRDRRLGRAILDGDGGYDEDRLYGVRVIDLGVMLAGADVSRADLRWTDLSDANLIRANLSGCDLVKANFSRTILYEANLTGADVKGTRFFYGNNPDLASPRSRNEIPNYTTGEFTGAVVENADFTDVQEMSEEQRKYCCMWCGEKSRSTIPGGCEGIPDRVPQKKLGTSH
jgi:uncharacterized protein YjbI with pentapeptide repeats